MLANMIRALKTALQGRRLTRSIRDNDRAADELDAALREVLKR